MYGNCFGPCWFSQSLYHKHAVNKFSRNQYVKLQLVCVMSRFHFHSTICFALKSSWITLNCELHLVRSRDAKTIAKFEVFSPAAVQMARRSYVGCEDILVYHEIVTCFITCMENHLFLGLIKYVKLLFFQRIHFYFVFIPCYTGLLMSRRSSLSLWA